MAEIPSSLVAAFSSLTATGRIKIGVSEIRLTNMNPRDFPWIKEHIPTICEYLFEEISSSSVQFDAVAGVPTGGEAWAKKIAELAEKPFYQLDKVYGSCFAIIDGQDVSKKSKLLVVDDTIYTGRTLETAVFVLEEAGFKIAGIASPVAISDRGCNRWRGRDIQVFTAYDNDFVQQHHGGW